MSRPTARAAVLVSVALSALVPFGVRAVAVVVAADASAQVRARPAASYGYDVPVDRGSPWPEMRRDGSNSARSPVAAVYHPGRHPWAFGTARGIFSTPVIGGDGTIYVGSADHSFYAINPDGSQRWRFRTGGIIDAAAAIGRYDPALGTTPITIGSGDERLYHLTAGSRSQPPRVIWSFRPSMAPVPPQLVNWWEGNVALGPDGTIYAGNTGASAYAIRPDGRQRWVYTTTNSLWTTPAFGADGSSWWGSLDLSVHHLDAAGRPLCSQFTLGYVVSSPAIGSDGTIYVASFDSKLYALDPATCAAKWTVGTADHVYASPALGVDAAGHTNAVYVASADGSVYKLDTAGRVLWRYDTGDAIRSSPALGEGPPGSRSEIVYVGSSNGKLYALDAGTGRRRWSFDTTPSDPILRDRNDLNGSPALGTTGVYIGGESGYLYYVPYDYCLHSADPRCSRDPGEDFGSDAKRVLYVTSGGSTVARAPPYRVSPATTINARLLLRTHGQTVNAAMVGGANGSSSDALVSSSPPFAFTTQLSGDGHFLFISPTGFLAPNTVYRVHVGGSYATGGTRTGNETVGATVAGSFGGTISFRTSPARGPLPLSVSRNAVTALVIRRLAVPLPAFLPSVNQIGFDNYDLIAGTLYRSPPDSSGGGRVLLWVIGARRDARGVPLADPRGNFAFPLAGRYRGDALILSDQNVALRFSFGNVPMRRFDLRGELGPDLRFRPGASLYAEVTCADVPGYGAALAITGICNHSGTLAASGTFIGDPYSGAGPANRRPRGLRVGAVSLARPTAAGAGSASATLTLARGVRYPAASHIASILLVDARSGAPVPLDYRRATSFQTDAAGNLSRVSVAIPAGTQLPATVTVYVIADVFGLGTRTVGG